jgi:WD40 repeat protein
MGGIQEHYDLFISYGRVDSKAFAIDLRNCLSAAQYQVWLDLEEIPPAVNYQQYINGAIEQADNFCFIISPHAVHSPHCLIELELALQYGKRIIPIMQVETISRATWQHRHPEGTEADWQQYVAQGLHSSEPAMPETLQQLNWIFYREGVDDSEVAFQQLVETLNAANVYVHRHTTLLVKALEWDCHQRQTQYLLSGEDRPGAELWLKTEFNDSPAPCHPTTLHGEYITESIKNADNLATRVFVINAGVEDALVRQLHNSLMGLGITVWLDHSDAQAGVNLKAAIKQGIEKTDNVVFLRGAQTVLQNWAAQLRYAQSLNKRIIPLCVGDQLLPFPETLHHCHWIALEQPDDADQYQNAVNKLLFTLHQEVDYFATHKRLLVQALKWEQQNRHPCLLLQGHNLRRAEDWLRLAQERNLCPAIDLQSEFIQASLSAPRPDSLDVFISYSRVDGELARRLNEALQIQGKTTWFDQESIAPGENFRQEIYQGIARCDNVLFLLSPRSVRSPYCTDEVTYAARLNKRFITVLGHPVDAKAMPAPLAEVQWIDFSQGNQDFFSRFSQLVRALETDREYIHQHTKWSQQAMNWLEDGQNPDLLLRGSEFAIAAQWLHRADTLDQQPAPTDHQRQFITASQKSIEAAKAAEAERQAELLRLEQARTQEAEARLEEEKKSARRQRRFLEAVALALLLTIGLGSATYLQYRKATVNQITALVSSSNNYFNSDQKLEALITAIKAGKIFRQNPVLRWRKRDLEHRTNAVLQQAIAGFDEENRFVANASEESEARGHRDRVTGVAFSPDGETLASSSWDGTVQLWGLSGEHLHTFRPDSPSTPKTTESSELAVDSSVSAESSEAAADLSDRPRFTEVAFSPDGQLLAAGNENSKIYLWNMETREPANPFNLPIDDDRHEFFYRGHNDVPNSLAFGQQQGQLLLASGHRDEMVRLWNLDPDAESIITQKKEDHTPKLGELIRMCRGSGNARGGAVLDVAISADGWLVASGGESHHFKPLPDPDHPEKSSQSEVYAQTIRLWAVEPSSPLPNTQPWTASTRPCRLVGTLRPDQSIHSVAFAQQTTGEDRLLATGSNDGSISLWQLESNGVTSSDPIASISGHQGPVIGLTFTEDDKYLISGSWDKTIKIWRVSDGALMRTLYGHTAAVMDVDVFWDEDKYRILSGGDDATVRLWQFKPDQVTKLVGHDGAVLSLAYSPDGKYLASGSDDRTLRVWPLEQDKVGGNALFLTEPALAKPEDTSPETTAPDKSKRPPLAHTDSIWSVAFNPTDSTMLASAGWDKRVKVWRLPQPGRETPVERQVIRDHRDRVNSLTFSPNGNLLITGSWDRRVKLWQRRDETFSLSHPFRYFHDLTTPGHGVVPQKEIYAVAYSGHDLIAAASGDRTIYIWNQVGQLIAQISDAHDARIFSLAFSPTQPNLLASGGADYQVKLWSIDQKGPAWQVLPPENERLNPQQATHTGPVHTVAFSYDGQYLASASRDKTIKVWKVLPDTLKPQFETTLTGHNDVVVALAFHPSKMQLASGSDDQSILLWDVSDLEDQNLGNFLGRGCQQLTHYLDNSEDALARENRDLCSGIELPATAP